MNDLYRYFGNIFYPHSSKDAFEMAGNWPDGGVDVDENTYFKFIQKPPVGKLLGTGANLEPCWVDIPPLTHEQLVNQAEYEKTNRITRINEFINSRQWPGKAALGRLSDKDKELYGRALDYLDALNAIDPQKAPDINWPAFEGYDDVA